MLARTRTASLFGVSAVPITIEADVSGGLPRFGIVGLPDVAIRESGDRVRAAVKRAGFEWPPGRITINLAPADLPKAGSALDLGIALAILAATDHIPPRHLEAAACFGELSLSGEVRPAPGALAVARAVARQGGRLLLTAPTAAREAALVPELAVYAVSGLAEAVHLLKLPPAGRGAPVADPGLAAPPGAHAIGPDLADLRGQTGPRRALEVAAAGGHNILFIGPPGSGKSMLAQRLAPLLPPPDLEEALEITQVASCAGFGRPEGLILTRPFRAPHHSITGPGLVGGGRLPAPGEASLAHGGVLFLDEIAEFPRHVLERLRQPLEDRRISISRAGHTAEFPCRFLLIAASNPCPCGYLGDLVRPCPCTPPMIARYRSHLSGPLLDRIDLQVEVPRVESAALLGDAAPEPTRVVRERVLAARRVQIERYRGTGFRVNADLDAASVRRFAAPSAEGKRLLGQAIETLGLSARAHDRILKVARTLADLAGEESVGEERIAEAIAYRSLDRPAAKPG